KPNSWGAPTGSTACCGAIRTRACTWWPAATVNGELNKSLFLQTDGERLWRWLAPGEAPRGDAGDAVLVVPAERALLREVKVADAERRLLRRTVPYSLEEELLGDVEAQHFAFGELRG